MNKKELSNLVEDLYKSELNFKIIDFDCGFQVIVGNKEIFFFNEEGCTIRSITEVMKCLKKEAILRFPNSKFAKKYKKKESKNEKSNKNKGENIWVCMIMKCQEKYKV